MKTDRSAIFAVFALILLVIIVANLGVLDLSPVPAPTPAPPTGTPLPTATATRGPTPIPTLTPTITLTPTPQTVFQFDRENFPSCFNSRIYEGMRAYSLGGRLHLVISSAVYDYQICEEQEFSDFVYEADVTLVDTAPADAEFALIARYNLQDDGNNQYYELTVWDSTANLYYLDTNADPSWTTLLGPVPVPVFDPGGSNRVKLLASGDVLAFFINDVFIGQAQDRLLASGYVGVSLSNYGSPSYDQHVVYEAMRVTDLNSPDIVYEESEFAGGGCFGEGSGEGYQTSALDGQYQVQVTAGNYFMAPCQDTGLEPLTDFILEADVVQQDAGNSGLAFRTNTDTGAMYAFLMDPAGYATLVYYPNATESPTALMDWTSVKGGAAVGELNHIKVIAVGETILIYVNGSLAAEVQDGSATSGGIALIALASEADFQTIFDNVKITSLVVP